MQFLRDIPQEMNPEGGVQGGDQGLGNQGQVQALQVHSNSVQTLQRTGTVIQ